MSIEIADQLRHRHELVGDPLSEEAADLIEQMSREIDELNDQLQDCHRRLASGQGRYPAKDCPRDGTAVMVTYETIMRYQPYKSRSQQARMGIKGRWQEMNEYGGWENTHLRPASWDWPVNNKLKEVDGE